MSITSKLRVALQKFLVKTRVSKMIELENEIAQEPEFISGGEDNKFRFDIPLEGLQYAINTGRKISITPRTLPILLPTVKDIFSSLNEAKSNPLNPKTQISPELLGELEKIAEKAGIGSVGFTKVPDKYIFQEKGIRYRNAIVVTMEMDKEKIESAPSIAAMKEILNTYHNLGKAVLKISRFLKKNGFGAQAVHPLGGVVMLVPLAIEANLGWIGHQGLVISPKFGPRMRLAAVLTSIENLPFTDSSTNEYSWIQDWCDSCKACLRKCPGKAILDPTIEENSDYRHYIEIDKCFPHFIEEYGCSICIKVCPFSKVGYEKVKRMYEKRKLKTG